MTQECVDYTLFHSFKKSMYCALLRVSLPVKTKDVQTAALSPRSSHTQAMEPSVKLDKMGSVSALCVEDG